MKNRLLASVTAAALASTSVGTALAGTTPSLAQNSPNYSSGLVRHVLLISIDGMHSLDFINCASGLPSVNNGLPYCPHLASLKASGVNYLDASTPRPSDSFPGLMAIVSGGSPRSVGAFYDVAYDRSLQPPAVTTGNGVQAGSCKPNQVPTGTTTEYEEGVDINQAYLNGVGPTGGDGGIASIDPNKLPRDPADNCQPVYPWNFVRTNTIFGVIKAAGGYTAWADKHPSYSSVAGPGNGGNLDDFYSPEINSIPVSLPGVTTASGLSCSPLPDQTAVGSSADYTVSFQNIQCYDQLKVNAILNQINRKTHDGSRHALYPNLFGMNFQSVSIGQKLIEKTLSPKVTGGYLDNVGTPTPALLSEIQFVDSAIGQMVSALKATNSLLNTMIVITAKHGQSPVDNPRFTEITTNGPVTTSPATILDTAGCLPASESPSSNGIGPTEDDVSLIWLNNSSATCSVPGAVSLLESQSPASANIAGIGQIFSGPALSQLFNAPGLPPYGDPRTPDIIVAPNVGVTYTGSSKKQAEHGGFAHDDTNVILLLSNPLLRPGVVTTPVTTMQVAPTILKAVGLHPEDLQSVQIEGTQALPGVSVTP
jgi:predicted AlkP superfamily pyrophosphatase or phosphodiesterase